MSALKEFHRSNLCAESCYKCVYEFLMTNDICTKKRPNLYLYLCGTCWISDAYEIALYIYIYFSSLVIFRTSFRIKPNLHISAYIIFNMVNKIEISFISEGKMPDFLFYFFLQIAFYDAQTTVEK